MVGDYPAKVLGGLVLSPAPFFSGADNDDVIVIGNSYVLYTIAFARPSPFLFLHFDRFSFGWVLIDGTTCILAFVVCRPINATQCNAMQRPGLVVTSVAVFVALLPLCGRLDTFVDPVRG